MSNLLPDQLAPAEHPLRIFVPHCSDMLTDHLIHGDGQIAYGFLRSLAARGYDLHVATPRLEVEEPLPANLHVYILRTRLSGALGRLEYMLRVRRLYTSLARRRRFDVLHQMNPVFAGISLALFGVGRPLVLGTFVARWPDDPATLSSSRGLRGRLIAWARDRIAQHQQRQADLLLLTAPAALNRLPAASAVQSKIRWLSHGVDTALFSPAPDFLSVERRAAEQHAPRVLFLAGISLRKGILPLVHAWKTVIRELPAARLSIVGDGPDLKRAVQLAADLELTASIHFKGSVPRSATPDLYREHALYVLPSFGEPFATSIIEAMSCGLPIVYTAAGGLPYLVPEGGGVPVPIDDHVALASAILDLLESPQRRSQMALTNRDFALGHLQWSAIGASLAAFYAEAMRIAASR